MRSTGLRSSCGTRDSHGRTASEASRHRRPGREAPDRPRHDPCHRARRGPGAGRGHGRRQPRRGPVAGTDRTRRVPGGGDTQSCAGSRGRVTHDERGARWCAPRGLARRHQPPRWRTAARARARLQHGHHGGPVADEHLRDRPRRDDHRPESAGRHRRRVDRPGRDLQAPAARRRARSSRALGRHHDRPRDRRLRPVERHRAVRAGQHCRDDGGLGRRRPSRVVPSCPVRPR